MEFKELMGSVDSFIKESKEKFLKHFLKQSLANFYKESIEDCLKGIKVYCFDEPLDGFC